MFSAVLISKNETGQSADTAQLDESEDLGGLRVRLRLPRAA